MGFALVAMVAWALRSVFAEVATESMIPESATVVSYGVGTVVALGYVGLFRREAVAFPAVGVGYVALAGLFAGIGGVAFYVALREGRTAVVTPVSGTYSVLAAVLGVLVLGESLGLREAAGIGFAPVGVVLLAG